MIRITKERQRRNKHGEIKDTLAWRENAAHSHRIGNIITITVSGGYDVQLSNDDLQKLASIWLEK